jgi:cysteine synthase
MATDRDYAADRVSLWGRNSDSSNAMNRRARRRKARPQKRDAVRQTLAVIAVGALLGGSLFGTGEYIAARQKAAAAAAAAATASDDEIYTGSILYMPNEGRTCHQLLFNNRSGRFTDNGNVDCVNAAYRSPSEAKQWSVARVRVISNNFRDR